MCLRFRWHKCFHILLLLCTAGFGAVHFLSSAKIYSSLKIGNIAGSCIFCVWWGWNQVPINAACKNVIRRKKSTWHTDLVGVEDYAFSLIKLFRASTLMGSAGLASAVPASLTALAWQTLLEEHLIVRFLEISRFVSPWKPAVWAEWVYMMVQIKTIPASWRTDPFKFKCSFPMQQYINFKLAVLAIASPGLINLFVRDGVHGKKDSNRSEMTVNRRNRPHSAHTRRWKF